MATPNDLQYFLANVRTPLWLDLLTETGMLDPPDGQAPWPAFSAVERLAGEHDGAVATWLQQMYDRWGAYPMRAWFIARAAVDLGTPGQPVVLAAVRAHPDVAGILHLGGWAAEKADPTDIYVEELADVLLNEASWKVESTVGPLLKLLVRGIDEHNSEQRVRLLCFKIKSVGADDHARRWFTRQNSGSAADQGAHQYNGRFNMLVGSMLNAVRAARQWLSTESLLNLFSELPDDIAARFRVWLLGEANDVDPSAIVAEIAAAITQRSPYGDDLKLIDRCVADCTQGQYAGRWEQALGTPPGIEELGKALAAHERDPDWMRVWEWISILPEEAIGSWAPAQSVLIAAYGERGRSALENKPVLAGAMGRSPWTVNKLRALPVEEAARQIASWRPDPSQWLVSARALAHTLEETVKEEPSLWLVSPLRIATALRHPMYINYYLSALASVEWPSSTPVNEILDVVALVRTHPWESAPLGRRDFDFDPSWRGAERSGIDLFKALADTDTGFGERADEVWAILATEVADRSETSGIVSGARDPLDSAINRPCTRALEAALSFMAHEFRTHGTVRPEALELLEATLRLGGEDGAEHRAILAPCIGFLRYIAPVWIDEHQEALFGSGAPDGLGQVTLDLASKWGGPNAWLMENFRDGLRDAVGRGVENSLDHMLIGMLWSLPGYSITEVVKFLGATPTLLSHAGEMLGRRLRGDGVERDHVEFAVPFWRAALKEKSADGLLGFGWFAEVSLLEPGTWAELTLATVQRTHGRIEWAHQVAERAAEMAPSATTLAILNELVRGAIDEWDRRRVIELAVATLQQAAVLQERAEYERLRTTLLARGAL